MKSILVVVQALALSVLALPAPAADGVDYSKVDYSKIDFSKLDYSKVDYSKIDFSKVDYSKVDFSKIPPKNIPSFPFQFTSTFQIVATPNQVVNASNITTGGLAGTTGFYNLGINSIEEVICFNITLVNFRGDFVSPARTATHIHQANKLKAGPPRVAFPNPQPVAGRQEVRRSLGCLVGPFTTGINNAAGVDTGVGFKLEQIEKNPSNFFADVHSTFAVAGAVRGQFA